MKRISTWVVPILVLLTLHRANSVEQNVKLALVEFMDKLSLGVVPADSNWGWNASSDPCIDKWMGVNCTDSQRVRKIVLEGFNFDGTVDAASLCMAVSIQVLSLNGNGIGGPLPGEIGNCNHLTHLFVSGNEFSGPVPDSIWRLSALKRLDISSNSFSGELPALSKMSGLLSFFAQDNNLSGSIPNMDFSSLIDLNVSDNNFSGPIPDTKGKFKASSFLGNPGLCGSPLPNPCLPSPAPVPSGPKSKHTSNDRYFIYLGYIILVLVASLLFIFSVVRKNRSNREPNGAARGRTAGDSNSKSSSTSSGLRNGRSKQESRSEYSITSAESGITSTSLLVLTSPGLEGLKFEDLLRAPAELLGRGKHGSLYKVTIDGSLLVVKRIKCWDVPGEDFKNRMVRIDQVRHPRIMSPIALYCSKQEKLLVYRYQPNDSLFTLLHGSQSRAVFDWGSRLRVAALVAESLAFMHGELRGDGIAHGNLKSTNILFDNDMEPCITEYGLMVVQNQDRSNQQSPTNSAQVEQGVHDTFKADVYCFGVILLELLTGKIVQNNGFDLARWVHSVVREEWTAEVFDKALVLEGVNEERMVNLLQVALKCINPSPDQRPRTDQVVSMVNMIKEEEERSNGSDS